MTSLGAKVIVRGLAFPANFVRLVLNGNVSKAEADMAAKKLKYVVENWKCWASKVFLTPGRVFFGH